MQKELGAVKKYLLDLQQSICRSLESIDVNHNFLIDDWETSAQSSGISCVLEGGDVFEKAGVNFSHVRGDKLPLAASKDRTDLTGCAFEAMGVSLVIHPRNPFVPTSHMNIRIFVAHKPDADPVWWFGGGYDLTPYYGFVEDCKHWHQTAKNACAAFGENIYDEFKQNCDDYFYLPHRAEARGIGGLFFDDLNRWDFPTCFDFMKSIGNSFVPAYLPIVEKRKETTYTKQQREFQCYRRGRYVEFNLVYDRGTLFGLQSKGRTESILMSLPAEVHWRYNWQPEPDSEEEKLTVYYLQARDWL